MDPISPEQEPTARYEATPREDLYHRLRSFLGSRANLRDSTSNLETRRPVFDMATMSGSQNDRAVRGPQITEFLILQLPESVRDHMLAAAQPIVGQAELTPADLGKHIFSTLQPHRTEQGDLPTPKRRELIRTGTEQHRGDPLFDLATQLSVALAPDELETYGHDAEAAITTWYQVTASFIHETSRPHTSPAA